MRRTLTTAALAIVVGVLSACAPTDGGAGETAEPTEAAAETITVATAETDAGTALVGPDEMTLYIFTQDTDGTSTCAGECAANWPPLIVPEGGSVEAGEGVTGELGTTERDDGGAQVTYEGMPLYYFAADEAPGDATGEGVGDVWFIATPEGAPMDEGGEATESESAAPTPDDYEY